MLLLFKSVVRVRGYTTGKGAYHMPHERHIRPGSGRIDPHRFVKAPDGGTDFGEISDDLAKVIGRQSGKIRLQVGEHRDAHSGYGIVHILKGHPEITDIPAFVADVAKHFNEVWRSRKGRLLLVRKGESSKAPVAVVELKPHAGGVFYSVITAFTKRRAKGDELLWSAAHPRSDEPGNHPVLGRDHLIKAGEMRSYADRKEVTFSMKKSTISSRGLAMTHIPLLFILKSLIPAHTRRLKSGKVVRVRQYSNKVNKHPDGDDRNLDMFADDVVAEPRQEMIDEHKRLVDVLNSPSHADDKAEAKKQAEELEEYEEGKRRKRPKVVSVHQKAA